MAVSAKIGALLWTAVLVASLCMGGALPLVETVFVFAPLVVVPVGMKAMADAKRVPDGLHRAIAATQPVGAMCVVWSFWLSPGWAAGLLAGIWLIPCLLIAAEGFRDWRRGAEAVPEFFFFVARLFLVAGTGGLIASRLGFSMMGFQEPIVLLTAVHFHYTGFAATILAAQLARFPADGARFPHLAKTAVEGATVATPLIAVGFLFSPVLKIAAIALLALSLSLVGGLSIARARQMLGVPRFFLNISGSEIFFGMALAVYYGIGEYTGRHTIGLAEMAQFHGVANAFGFVLCGLLAWTCKAKKEAVW